MRFFLTSAAVLTASIAHAAPQGLEIYGRLPTIEQIEISPDGSQLAIVATDGEARSVIVRGTAAGSPGRRFTAGQTKIREIQWAGQKDLILTTSQTSNVMDVVNGRREWTLAFDLNIDKGSMRLLLDSVPREGGLITQPKSGATRMLKDVLLGSPNVVMIDGQPKVFMRGIAFRENKGVVTLFRDELRDVAPLLIQSGTETTDGWVLASDGKILAERRVDPTGRWTIRLSTAAGTREILGGAESPLTMMGLGRVANTITVEQYDKNGDVALHEAGVNGLSEALGQGDDVSPIFDPGTGLLIGVTSRDGEDAKTTFFNERDQKAWDSVLKAFPGTRVRRMSWSDDRRKIVVRVDSPVDGPAFSLIDLDAKKAEWLSVEYDGLVPDLIASTRAVAFKAQDGLQLSGYLTLPHGSTGKNLPLIVFPHGGPASRDGGDYDWWAQGMASRGYAVLKVNFRGSTGLGKAFRDAGDGEWGRKMQTDLSDGVRYLAAQGVIDPKRVCIVGASYGGYAALAGATMDKGVYRCAVSYGGVADLPRMGTYVKGVNGPRTFQSLRMFVGADRSSDAVLAERSPALLASRADIPVLLIHGKDDTVVPLAQSQAMQTALNKAGKPTDLIVLDGEDHWLTSGATRLQMLKATMAFVEKNNPPN